MRKVFPILDENDLKSMIKVTPKERDQLIFKILYGTGIRVRELTNLGKDEISLKRLKGKIVNGKGGHDRFFVIHPKLADDM